MKIIKFLLLTTTLCCIFNSINAQVNKGAWQAGGTLSFSSMKAEDEDQRLNVLQVAPNVGYYIIDNLGVGLNFGFLSHSYDGDKSSTILVGPWARYYAYKSFFGQAGFNYLLLNFDGDNVAKGFQFDFNVGWSHWLNNFVALEPKLFFNTNTMKLNDTGATSKSNSLGLSIGLQVFLVRK